jgi:hypothetical protein
MSIIDLRVAAQLPRDVSDRLQFLRTRNFEEAFGRAFTRAGDAGGSRSRHHGKVPDEIDWSVPKRQTRAVSELLGRP